eukprot:5355794-Amphidinium_carterae.1
MRGSTCKTRCRSVPAESSLATKSTWTLPNQILPFELSWRKYLRSGPRCRKPKFAKPAVFNIDWHCKYFYSDCSFYYCAPLKTRCSTHNKNAPVVEGSYGCRGPAMAPLHPVPRERSSPTKKKGKLTPGNLPVTSLSRC